MQIYIQQHIILYNWKYMITILVQFNSSKSSVHWNKDDAYATAADTSETRSLWLVNTSQRYSEAVEI